MATWVRLVIGGLCVSGLLAVAWFWVPIAATRPRLSGTFVSNPGVSVPGGALQQLRSTANKSAPDQGASSAADEVANLFSLFQEESENKFLRWVESQSRAIPPRLADMEKRSWYWRVDTTMFRGADLRWNEATVRWLVRSGRDVGWAALLAELKASGENYLWADVDPERSDYLDVHGPTTDVLQIAVVGKLFSADGTSSFQGTVYFHLTRADRGSKWSIQRILVTGWPVGIRVSSPPL